MRSGKVKKPSAPASISQLEVLDSRFKFREYCRQNNITTPDFFASNQFNKISLWAMKKNTFPLCIKTSKNLSNNESIYILKAYRELPEFFENIQNKNSESEVLIEEFIEGKARLEITLFKGKIRLISQVSFNKGMRLKQRWRAFPISLPNNIFFKIQEIMSHFELLTEAASEPLRFSFIVKAGEPIILSVNQGHNRQEYDNEWRKAANLPPLEYSNYKDKAEAISKIIIYDGLKTSINLDDITKVCQQSKVKAERAEKKLYLMLSAPSIKALEEDFEKADAITRQLILEQV